MPKRSFTKAVAIVIFACLALSAPSNADYINTLTAINMSGKAADDFEATFTGTGGSVSDIAVQFSSGIATTTNVISSGAGVEIGFALPLPIPNSFSPGVVVFAFMTSVPNISLNTAEWTFKSGVPIPAPPGTVFFSPGQVTVPEPTSIALLGIGLSGLFTLRRFFKRTAVRLTKNDRPSRSRH